MELVRNAIMTLNVPIKYKGLTAIQVILVFRFAPFQTKLVSLAKMEHSVIIITLELLATTTTIVVVNNKLVLV